MPQHPNDPFAFLENSTTRALLGIASTATVGPGFLSEALALAPSAPQLMGEALRRLSIGNSLADAFGAGRRESQDSPPQQSAPPQSAPQSAPQPAQNARPEQTSGGGIDAVIANLDAQGVSDAIDRLRSAGKLTPELSAKLLAQLEVVRGR